MSRRQRLRRPESQAQTREALMEAAERLFDTKGLAGTSITEIVDDAGYTTGALYSNFANKEELFIAVVERQITMEMTALGKALSAEPSIEERLRLVGHWYASKAGQGRRRMRALAEITLLSRHRDPIHEQLRQRLQDLEDAVAALIRQQEDELGITFELPIPTLAAGVVALLQGFGLQHALDDEDEIQVDPSQLVAVLRVLLRPQN